MLGRAAIAAIGVCAALGAGPVLGSPASASPGIDTAGDPGVLFSAGGETGDTSEWCFRHSAVTANVGVSTEVAREGRYSFRTELRDGATIYSTERSEFANGPGTCGLHRFREGDETWTAVSVFPAADFPKFSHWSLVTQWKEPQAGTPPQQINLANDTWSIFGVGSISPRPRVTIGTLQRGTWNDFVVHHRWSSDPTVGFVEVYFQGRLVVPRTPMKTMETGSKPLFLSVGQYRDTKPTTGTAALHVDAVRVGLTREAVEPPALSGPEPAPPAASPPPPAQPPHEERWLRRSGALEQVLGLSRKGTAVTGR